MPLICAPLWVQREPWGLRHAGKTPLREGGELEGVGHPALRDLSQTPSFATCVSEEGLPLCMLKVCFCQKEVSRGFPLHCGKVSEHSMLHAVVGMETFVEHVYLGRCEEGRQGV